MKKVHSIRIPSYIYSGEGSIKSIKDILKRERADSVLIFTDSTIREAGLVDPVIEEITKANAQVMIFEAAVGEPSYQDVEEMMRQTKNYNSALMIAIGGGSVMDVAKLYSVLKGASYSVKELLEDPQKAVKKIKTVMIPTTCGTGSEATCNSIVTIPEEETKKGIVNDSMISDYVILDSQMIKKLPKQIVAATGVDALAHAVECYTSKKATPLSDTYALGAAKLIFENIRNAYNNPDDMEAKSLMMLGAFYGGVAITGSGTTAVHALSYPLGGKFHIPHGVSNAILLAHIMRFNKEACIDQFSVLCDTICPSIANENKSTKAEYVIEQIEDIVSAIKIPTDLKEFGVSYSDLDFLVEAGSKQTRLLVNNQKEMSLSDIRMIYEKVLL